MNPPQLLFQDTIPAGQLRVIIRGEHLYAEWRETARDSWERVPSRFLSAGAEHPEYLQLPSHLKDFSHLLSDIERAIPRLSARMRRLLSAAHDEEM